MQNIIEDSIFAVFFRLKQNFGASISEQNAVCTISVIRYSRDFVGTDNDNFFVISGLHKLCTGDKRKNKSRTTRRQIESPSFRTYFFLNHANG